MAEPSKMSYRYQYGAAAPKYPYTSPTPDFTPIRRPKQQPKPKTDLGYIAKLVCCGTIVFTACIAFVKQTSILQARQRELRTVTSQVRETQSAINNVEAIIASRLDLDHIQNVAKTKLNMSEPLPHQVVYITLPQESYTVYND